MALFSSVDHNMLQIFVTVGPKHKG